MDSFSRIMGLAFRFNNADSAGAKIAAANIAVGKPAVWGLASFSHNGIGILVDALNRHGEVAKAVAECNAGSGRGENYGKHADWLDRIVPLNEAGVHLLADAYAVAGSFRFARELFDRAEKIGWAMLDRRAA